MITSIDLDDKIIETTIDSEGQLISFINLGASITRWRTKDGTDIVPAYREFSQYQMPLEPGMYLGATIGPIAGRIRDSAFDFGNRHYAMDPDYAGFLHSGKQSMAFMYFEIVRIGKDDRGEFVIYRLDYRYATFPASLDVYVRYTVKPGILEIDYDVLARENSLVNMTNHVYFNLEGDPSHDLSKTHILEIPASHVVLTDGQMVGNDIIKVAKTGFDFRRPRLLADALNDLVLTNAGNLGIDNYYILSKTRLFDAKIHSVKNNKTLTIKSDYPGLNLYTGNYPDMSILSNGKPMAFHGALAIEPHFQTNAVNDTRFEGYALMEGQRYHHRISYRLEEQT
ncbi:MAG TPA: hypothetical protein PLD07_01150 [Bacillota bacterium]|nr:hypothetical protein [Bacillota bacterium]HRX91734.1 hypothetical protein [Candidatus Izemoplasmatales bacterium]